LKPERTQEFSLADGTVVTRKISSAYIKFGTTESATVVILGEKDNSPLLGVVTLETLGLTISPFTREIYPDRLMPI
jgi:predicted aspartyl protease